MKIVLEKTKWHKFAFYYDFDPTVVLFCRDIKDAFTWKEFSFDKQGSINRWVFSKDIIIDVIKAKFPSVEIGFDVIEAVKKEKLDAENEKNKTINVNNVLAKTDTTFDVKGLKRPLYNYQKIGVEFLVAAGGRAINSDEMGCISGDMVVIVNRGGNAKKYKLRDLYKKLNNIDSNWDLNIASKTRSLTNDGLFSLNIIKKVLYKGEKDTIRINSVTSDGKSYSIELTDDHKIATPAGWIESKNLKVGDSIIVNGDIIKFCDICKDYTPHSMNDDSKKYSGKCKKCIYRYYRNNYSKRNTITKNGEHLDKSGYVLVSDAHFHPTNLMRKKSTGKTLRKHVLVYEAFINGVSYEEWLSMCKFNNIPKNSLFVDSSKYAIHHKNEDKRDNTIGNLVMISHLEHVKGHSSKNIRNLKYNIVPSVAQVTSVANGNKIDVYDIVMNGDNRNFIANGVVVHNCGKSFQSIAFIKYMDFKRSLIVCPASVKYSWENEIKKSTSLSSVIIDSKTDIPSIDSSVKVWIINYDILKKHFSQLAKIKFDTIIADEAQFLKSNTTIRSKAFKQLSLNIPSVILLSGTPILSRPSELFSLLNIVDPKTWNNFFSFAKRYCNMQQTRWGMDTSGSSNEEELHEKIKGYFIRRKKEDVLKELPPKVFVDVPVLLDKDYKKKYDSAASNLAIYLREHAGKKDPEIRKAMAAEKLTQLNVLRGLSALGKIKTTIELIESIVDSGEKVLVFSSFVEPLEILSSHFQEKSVMITGKTNVNLRGEIVDSFQNNPSIQVFLGGYKSSGSGITLTAATNFIGIDLPWNPSDLAQSIDRLHRPGQKASSVNIYKLISKDTIDIDMKEILDRKQDIFNAVIDGQYKDDDTDSLIDTATNRILNNY